MKHRTAFFAFLILLLGGTAWFVLHSPRDMERDAVAAGMSTPTGNAPFSDDSGAVASVIRAGEEIGKEEESEGPKVTREQQDAAFEQLQGMLAGNESSETLAHFPDGAGESRWVEEDFAVRSDEYGNVIAYNPAQGFEADFTDLGEQGLRVRHHHGGGELKVKLTAIGAEREAMRPVAKSIGEAQRDGARVEFARGDGITEWYVNGEEGIEQGWVIEQTLLGTEQSGELRLGLELDAEEMEAMFEPGHRSGSEDAIVFRDREGREAWRYDKLKVFDANGHEIPARMEWSGPVEDGPAAVDLVVAAAGAAYPLMVDPLMSSVIGNIPLGSGGDSNPLYLTTIGSTTFFSANDGTNGQELWKSDGTPDGTSLVKDINPGSGGSSPNYLTNVDGTLFFQATDSTNGTELWKSDGTSAGTSLVKDIRLGSGSSGPQRLTNVDGTLYFKAYDPTNGYELWKSDGTAAGTSLVKDINPGSANSLPNYLTNVDGTLFFQAYDSTNGYELWKSDGTPAGTSLVKDINPGSGSSSPQYLTNVDGTLFFQAYDPTNRNELWKSDGSAAGTSLVKDINPGSGRSSPQYLTNVDGTLFFQANDGTNGGELWKSDGTSAGTSLIKDIYPGSGGSAPQYLTNVDGTLLFSASDPTNGNELWKSDGSAAGTSLVKDILPGSGSSFPNNLTNVDGTLFFQATDGTTGRTLWKSDGSSVGTTLVKDIPGSGGSAPIYLTNVDGTLFFQASDGVNGTELWKSDGSSAGTTLVKDISPSTGDVIGTQGLTMVGQTLYFKAYDPTNGTELWKSDGTAAGTSLVKDINPGSGGSTPQYLTDVDGTLFFSAYDPTNGNELWKSDGTPAGTSLVKDIRPGSGGSAPQYLTNVDGTLFFNASDPTNGIELWKSDGTAAGTSLVKDIIPGPGGAHPTYLTNVDGTLFFPAGDPTNGRELWKSDGTAAGTSLVKDIRPGSGGSSPLYLTNVDSTLYFKAYDPTNGTELWKSDGTAGGTSLVKDINPGSGSSSADFLTNVDSTLFFAASDGTNGTELWKSDGTAAGTSLVKDIYPGSGTSSAAFLTNVDGTLFFRANDPTNGFELWKSDGTAAGTSLVKDIYPGSGTSSAAFLTNVDGTLFFRAYDSTNGFELWKSDGTSAGTVIADELYPGPESSFPHNLFPFGDNALFFTTASPTGGRDLRILRLATPLTLNEFDPTTQSSDTREFLEIYDGGAGNTPLDGYTVVAFDGAGDTSFLALDLDGKSTDANGYFVIGNADVPGVDLVLPDSTFTGAVQAIALYEDDAATFPNGTAVTTTNLVDAIVFDIGGQPDDAGLLALLNTSEPQLDESGTGNAIGHSFQRLPNGEGGARNTSAYSLLSPTPGAENTLPVAPVGLDLTNASDTGGLDNDDLTMDNTPTLNGTARAGSIVTLSSSLDGNVGTAVADGSGAWTLTVNALSDGTHQLTATADGSPASGALAITIDTTAPAVPTSLDLSAGSDSGSSNTDNYTNDTTPTVSGDAPAGTAVTLLANGAPVGTGSANSPWTIVSSALTGGSYSFTATATDAAGNTSAASSGLSVTIDTTAPAAPAGLDLAPGSDTGVSNNDDITKATALTVSGSAENLATVALFSGASQVGSDASDGNWSITSSTLSEGNASLTATATDRAGNTSPASAPLVVSIDTTAPAAPTNLDLVAGSDTGWQNNDNNTADKTPTIVGAAANGSNVILRVDGAVAGSDSSNSSWSVTTSELTDGMRSFTATATDVAGNTSSASSALVVTIDTVAPAPPSAPDLTDASDTGSSNSDNITKETLPRFEGTVSPGTFNVTLYRGASLLGTDSPEPGWSIVANLPNGSYTVAATATDEAGNESGHGASLDVTIDTVAPTLTLAQAVGQDDPAEAGPVLFTATFNEDVTGFDESKVTVGGSAGGADTVLGGPAVYTVSVATTADEGTVTVSTGAGAGTDLAGNTSGAPTLGDTSVSLDSHGDNGNNATTLSFSNGSASAEGFLEPGDTDAFTFTLTEPKQATITTTGPVDTRGALFTDAGSSINDVPADADAGTDDHFLIEEVLAPGTYDLLVTSEGSAQTGAYTLSITLDNLPVLINEVDSATSISNSLEFVELYDGGIGNTPLDGLVLVCYLGNSEQSYLAVDLDGESTDEAGYFVLGSASVPNVDLIIPNQSLQDNRAAVALYFGDGSDFPNDTPLTTSGLLDAVVSLPSGGAATAQLADLLLPAQPHLDEAVNGFRGVQSLQRIPDGAGGPRVTDQYQVVAPTPGAANMLPPAPEAPNLERVSDSGISIFDDLTNVVRPRISGRARFGTIVRLSSDLDGDLGQGASNANGVYNILTTGIDLREGIHVITPTTVSTGETGPTLTIEIDTTAPDSPTGLDLEGTSDSGTSDSDDITNEPTPTFTGDAETGSIVTLFADASDVGTGSANSPWSITSTALADGNFAITTTATDAAGNESSPSSPLNVEIDTTAPTVSIDLATGQAPAASNGPAVFAALFSEAVLGFVIDDVSVTGSAAGAPSLSGGPTTFNISVETAGVEGSVLIHIPASIAEDTAGNANEAATWINNRINLDRDNSTDGSPTEISPGGGATTSFLSPDDVDTFTFSLSAASYVTVSTTGGLDTVGEVRNGSDTLVNDPNADDDLGEDENFSSYMVLGAGQYTVLVSARNSEEGDFDLNVVSTPVPQPVINDNTLLKSQLAKKIKKLKASAKKAKKKGSISKAKKIKKQIKKFTKQLKTL